MSGFSCIWRRRFGKSARTASTSSAALDDTLEELVTALLNNGPAAVRASKQLVVDFAGREITPEIIEDSCGRIAHIRVSEEGQEGLGAFLNKRKPKWLGD